MNFLRRRLIHSLIGFALALAGIGLKATFDPEGSSMLWQAMTGNRAEFDKVTDAIQSQSTNRRTPAGTRRITRNNTPSYSAPVEPKVIDIEYDDEKPAAPEKDTQSVTFDVDLDKPAKSSASDASKPSDTRKPQAVRPARSNEFSDTKRHYSLDLPAAWQEMSSQELSLINRAVGGLGFGAQIKYEAGFRRKNSKPGTYPYILVASKKGKLSSYSEVEQALERELPKSVKKAEDALSELASGVSIDDATVDRANNRIQFRSQLDVAGIGKIQGLSVGHIGSEGVVFVHSYSMAKEFSAWLPTFERINDSFAYDEGFAFVERSGQGSGDFSELLGSVTWVGWLAGAGLGAGAGVFVAMLFRPRRRRSAADDSMPGHDLFHDVTEPNTKPAENPPLARPVPIAGPAAIQLEHSEIGKSLDSTPSAARAAAWVVSLGLIGTAGWFGYSHRADLSALWTQVTANWSIESAEVPAANIPSKPQFAAQPGGLSLKSANAANQTNSKPGLQTSR